MAIITDHRPQSFDDVVGNKEVVATLRSMVETEKKSPGKISKTILLYGVSGCGKTSLARLFSKEIGISESNIIEVDVADSRGIDAMREIKKNAKYMPIIGEKRKVYIMDETHTLTSEGFSAMLKIFEEPPSHVFFILCTTNPEKLPETIRNRCKKLKVNPLNDIQMEKLISRIAKKEDVKVSQDMIDVIINGANGCPRQALDMLDTIRNMEDKNWEKALSDFSIKSPPEIIELCRAITKCEKWGVVRKLLESIKDADVENVRRQILGYLTAVIKNSDKPDKQVVLAADSFRDPFFNNGKSGLILAVYEATTL